MESLPTKPTSFSFKIGVLASGVIILLGAYFIIAAVSAMLGYGEPFAGILFYPGIFFLISGISVLILLIKLKQKNKQVLLRLVAVFLSLLLFFLLNIYGD
ncbi:MAG: hypothetical protein EAY81_04615 [Bacteroidetes bacterium]|nr:MAG: hypothetical protein EAY81_04615 [Bacteroidota bacterium]